METDEWTSEGKRVTDESLEQLRGIIADKSPIIVEHRFYRGARAPYRFVCDDIDVLIEYMRKETRAGDALWFWRFDQCCGDENAVLTGKVPDEKGRVPKGGAY
jgi:hypothetical protein